MTRQKAAGFCMVCQESDTSERFEATGLEQAAIRVKEERNGKLGCEAGEEELPPRLPQKGIPFFCS